MITLSFLGSVRINRTQFMSIICNTDFLGVLELKNSKYSQFWCKNVCFWDFQLRPRLIASNIFGSERMNWNWLLVSTGLQSFRGARTQNAKVKTILLQKFMSLGTFGPKDPYSIMNRPRTLENWILQVHPDSKAPFYVILSKKKISKLLQHGQLSTC